MSRDRQGAVGTTLPAGSSATPKRPLNFCELANNFFLPRMATVANDRSPAYHDILDRRSLERKHNVIDQRVARRARDGWIIQIHSEEIRRAADSQRPFWSLQTSRARCRGTFK
jgi:hypothetical protein